MKTEDSVVLSATHLSRAFLPIKGDAPIEVLKDINFSLQQGERLAIVGSSGSGKSTLLSLIAGLDSPTHGAIHMRGRDLASMDEDALAKFRAQNLGMIFQRFHLLPHLTALENCALPLDLLGEKQAMARALAMLQQVDLAHRADHFPSKLSGGECQRVAIARALISEPALILADEPTGNLDDDHAKVVANILFERVRANRVALILVTHNLALAQSCDRILRLHNGVLHHDG